MPLPQYYAFAHARREEVYIHYGLFKAVVMSQDSRDKQYDTEFQLFFLLAINFGKVTYSVSHFPQL